MHAGKRRQVPDLPSAPDRNLSCSLVMEAAIAERRAFKAWFPRGERPHYPVMRLLCFHGAGSDSFLYLKGDPETKAKNPLVQFCDENQIELLSAHLPGRTVRKGEPFLNSISEMACSVLDALEASGRLGDEISELCVVGHSMGGFLAYEVLRELRRRKGATPRALFVCSMIAPTVAPAERLWKEESRCESDAFREQIEKWSANPAIFESEMWKIYEPILRADLRAVGEYWVEKEGENSEVPPKEPLAKALYTWTASKDCFVPAESMTDWPLSVGLDKPIRREMFESSHNLSDDHKGRKEWFQQMVEELDKIILDVEYA